MLMTSAAPDETSHRKIADAMIAVTRLTKTCSFNPNREHHQTISFFTDSLCIWD